MREQGGAVPADEVEARLIKLREKKRVMNSNIASRTRLKPDRAKPKVGRNDPCPCGSGIPAAGARAIKYKFCCGK